MAAGVNLAVKLYNTSFAFVADVVVASQTIPPSLPAVITYLGVTYAWSDVYQRYLATTPVAAAARVAEPFASVVADPDF
jgi:hypothetical protein